MVCGRCTGAVGLAFEAADVDDESQFPTGIDSRVGPIFVCESERVFSLGDIYEGMVGAGTVLDLRDDVHAVSLSAEPVCSPFREAHLDAPLGSKVTRRFLVLVQGGFAGRMGQIDCSHADMAEETRAWGCGVLRMR